MHAIGEALIEPHSGGTVTGVRHGHRCTEAEGRTAEGPGRGTAVADSNGNNRHVHPLALRQLGQAHQALMQTNRFVLALNLALRKHHQLLTGLQQINREPQGRHRRTALIHGKAAEPLQKPTLQPSHFGGGDHEAAITAGHASTGRHRQHQRIPSGPVGGCQQNGAAVGQVMGVQNNPMPELQFESDVLGHQHGQRRPARVNAHLQSGFAVCQIR